MNESQRSELQGRFLEEVLLAFLKRKLKSMQDGISMTEPIVLSKEAIELLIGSLSKSSDTRRVTYYAAYYPLRSNGELLDKKIKSFPGARDKDEANVFYAVFQLETEQSGQRCFWEGLFTLEGREAEVIVAG